MLVRGLYEAYVSLCVYVCVDVVLCLHSLGCYAPLLFSALIA